MTPEQESYAALWMSECWAPVREWREPAVDRAVHAERNALLDRVRDERVAS